MLLFFSPLNDSPCSKQTPLISGVSPPPPTNPHSQGHWTLLNERGLFCPRLLPALSPSFVASGFSHLQLKKNGVSGRRQLIARHGTLPECLLCPEHGVESGQGTVPQKFQYKPGPDSKKN